MGLVDSQWQSITDAEKSETVMAKHNNHLDRWQCEKETGRLGMGRGGEWKEGGKGGKGGREYFRATANFNSQVLLWIFVLLFLFYKNIFFYFLLQKECLRIIQHFICAILRSFLWRFKLLIAINKSLSSFYLSYFYMIFSIERMKKIKGGHRREGRERWANLHQVLGRKEVFRLSYSFVFCCSEMLTFCK